jgi:hypothetical protein
LCTNPHQHAIVLVYSQLFGVDEFVFQVSKIIVRQGKASFQDAVGDALLTLEQCDDLGEEGIKIHGRGSTALASAISYP